MNKPEKTNAQIFYQQVVLAIDKYKNDENKTTFTNRILQLVQREEDIMKAQKEIAKLKE